MLYSNARGDRSTIREMEIVKRRVRIKVRAQVEKHNELPTAVPAREQSK